MPIGILIAAGITTAISAAAGAKKTVDATGNFRQAKRIGKEAGEKYNKNKEEFEKEEESLKKRIEKYGLFKVRIYTETMRDRFLPVYKEFEELQLDELDGYKPIRTQDLENIEQNTNIAGKIASGAVGGLFGGAATGVGMAAGAWGLAGIIGTASTGTAISTLSGAAATSATMAWLGGGALTIGGLGMAGGAAVLSGLVAGPAIAITGFAIAKKSETALTEASKHSDDVDAKCAEIKNIITNFKMLHLRCDELQDLVEKFERKLIDQIGGLRTIITNKKSARHRIQDRELDDEDKKNIRIAGAYAKAIQDLLNIALVDSDGRANSDVVSKIEEYRPLLIKS